MGENAENRVITFLEGLTPAAFTQVIVRTPGADRKVPNGVSDHERVTALIHYVRSSTGMGIERFVEEILIQTFPDASLPLFPNTRLIRDYLNWFQTQMKVDLEQKLRLSTQDQPDAIAHHSEITRYITMSPLHSRQDIVPLPLKPSRVFNTFSEAFQAQEKRVLLLGIPGAGKTTTLLQFAYDAVQARISDPGQPIPIFQSIHRWDHKLPLPEWAQEWIKAEFPGIDLKHHPLLYIFDGLDELGSERPVDPVKPDGEKYDPRLRFLEAVAKELPDAQVVISCRELDYEQIGEKAKLRGAVRLLPLNADQIRTFLIGKNQLLLWTSLENDEHLLQLAETPLLLALLSKSVGEADNLTVTDTSSLNANTIFDFYIRMMFVHEKEKRELPFTEAMTRGLLSKLGSAMLTDYQYPSVSLDMRTTQKIIGEGCAKFITFAIDMHFLRRFSDSVQFVHLKFRDFCAVPALIDALKHKHADARGIAADTLGELRDARAVDPLIVVLRDTYAYVRFKAANALTKLGDARAVPALSAALGDPDVYVREGAAFALGELRDARAIGPLIPVLRDVDAEVRKRAVDALVKLGDAALPALIDALKHQYADLYIRRQATNALVKLKDVRTIPVLVAALGDPDVYVRGTVVNALGALRDARTIPALIGTLGDVDAEVRGRAADALVKLGNATVPALIDALKHQYADARGSAAFALGELRDARTIPALIGTLGDVDAEVRGRAADALVKLGNATVPALIDALKHQYADARGSAIYALVKLRDVRAVDPLIAALRDPDVHVRRRAVNALVKLGDARAVAPLIAALEDEDAEVREGAADSLGELRDARALSALIATLGDTDVYVRGRAIDALVKLGDIRAVPALITTLCDIDVYVRRRAADTLGELRDARAVDPLIAALTDTDVYVRGAATDALVKLEDDRAVPALVDALKHKHADTYVRKRSADALVKLGDVRALPALINALRDPDAYVRRRAADTLVRLGDIRTIPPSSMPSVIQMRMCVAGQPMLWSG